MSILYFVYNARFALLRHMFSLNYKRLNLPSFQSKQMYHLGTTGHHDFEHRKIDPAACATRLVACANCTARRLRMPMLLPVPTIPVFASSIGVLAGACGLACDGTIGAAMVEDRRELASGARILDLS